MSLRFAILHHQCPPGEHWDFLLEQDDALRTWQLPRPPGDGADLPMPAARIQDHRKAYLTYEGPVSRDRGTVARIEEGALEYELVRNDRLIFVLHGRRLVGRFRLDAQTPDAWTLARAEAPESG